MKNEAITQELERISNLNGGILKPEHVVEHAKDPQNPLHSQFQWDDSKAAHEYRLWQARQLIRVTVSTIKNTETVERVWVNLKSERATESHGYRKLVSVLNDEELRKKLIQQSIEDMEYFQQKYQRLTELSEVFESMTKAKSQLQEKELDRAA